MAQASGVTIVIERGRRAAVLGGAGHRGAEPLGRNGLESGTFRAGRRMSSQASTRLHEIVLYDPQTSGGLLIAADAASRGRGGSLLCPAPACLRARSARAKRPKQGSRCASSPRPACRGLSPNDINLCFDSGSLGRLGHRVGADSCRSCSTDCCSGRSRRHARTRRRDSFGPRACRSVAHQGTGRRG